MAFKDSEQTLHIIIESNRPFHKTYTDIDGSNIISFEEMVERGTELEEKENALTIEEDEYSIQGILPKYLPWRD